MHFLKANFLFVELKSDIYNMCIFHLTKEIESFNFRITDHSYLGTFDCWRCITLNCIGGEYNSERRMIDVPLLHLYSWDSERRGRWRSPVAPHSRYDLVATESEAAVANQPAVYATLCLTFVQFYISTITTAIIWKARGVRIPEGGEKTSIYIVCIPLGVCNCKRYRRDK